MLNKASRVTLLNIFTGIAAQMELNARNYVIEVEIHTLFMLNNVERSNEILTIPSNMRFIQHTSTCKL